ncbi:MAG: riboflavin synthase [Planctomycetia bacterium]|nr:riboflavin synthase [Planctomycetia bacterium]
MFTGLVELKASVAEVREEPPGRRLRIAAPAIAAEAVLGESICVSGCCLTVVAMADGLLDFEAGPETLSRTTLGSLVPGSFVNLERSLRLSDRLGGHLVTGHIDCSGTLDARQDLGEWSEMWFRLPREYARQTASKGSIAIEGVSLTVVMVEDERFSVQLIPHTLEVTTLGTLRVGDRVNLETDLLAKYVARQLAGVISAK